MRNSLTIFGILLLLVLSVAGSAAARIWNVPEDAPTIAAGLDSATVGDEVVVACGTYTECMLLVPSGVTLRSEYGTADCVTIAGPEPYSWTILECNHAESQVSIIGFTITGGVADGNHWDRGGGILSYHSPLYVENCDIVGNRALMMGGGIHVQGGELTLVNCRIEDNETMVGSGGGLFCFLDGTRIFAFDTRIQGNTAPTGPDGVNYYGCSIEFTCCDIDLENWVNHGEIFIFDDDCDPTAGKSTSWSALKALYR